MMKGLFMMKGLSTTHRSRFPTIKGGPPSTLTVVRGASVCHLLMIAGDICRLGLSPKKRTFGVRVPDFSGTAAT